MQYEVHRMVTAREANQANIIEYRSYKLVYRKYAGLFCMMAVDVSDNELIYLEAIHLFVELLDQYFQNVCELDLVRSVEHFQVLRNAESMKKFEPHFRPSARPASFVLNVDV